MLRRAIRAEIIDTLGARPVLVDRRDRPVPRQEHANGEKAEQGASLPLALHRGVHTANTAPVIRADPTDPPRPASRTPLDNASCIGSQTGSRPSRVFTGTQTGNPTGNWSCRLVSSHPHASSTLPPSLRSVGLPPAASGRVGVEEAASGTATGERDTRRDSRRDSQRDGRVRQGGRGTEAGTDLGTGMRDEVTRHRAEVVDERPEL